MTSLHPLLERLVAQGGARLEDGAAVDAFAAAPGESVLFFTEDPVRVRETLDLAVILPEVRRAAPRPFRIGMLSPAVANERAATYGVRRWPALVFLRDGAFLGTIEGLREWAQYVELSRALLCGPVQALPPKVIPVAAQGARSCP